MEDKTVSKSTSAALYKTH